MATDALTNRLDIQMDGRSSAGESFQEPQLIYTHEISFGTGEGKCNEESCIPALTIPAEAANFITLALFSGEILNAAGTPIGLIANSKGEQIVFTNVRRLIIAIVSPTGIPLVVGNAASLKFQGPLSSSGTQTIPGYIGALLLWENKSTAGYPVNGTATNLKLTNTELTPVVVSVYIAGEGTTS